jgi:hypothetical protein
MTRCAQRLLFDEHGDGASDSGYLDRPKQFKHRARQRFDLRALDLTDRFAP